MSFKKSILIRKAALAGVLTLLGLAAVQPLLAQETPTYKGSNARVGRHDADQRLNTPGRSFLRWFDPVTSVANVIDNWQPGADWNPFADWFVPAGDEAALPVTAPGQPDYRYAFSVPSLSFEEPTKPAVGSPLRTFTWTLGGVLTGAEYAIAINIPVGPSDIDPSDGYTLRFPQRYYVVEISGVVNDDDPGQPVLQIVDTFKAFGGYVRLGNNGDFTQKLYTATGNSGQIVVTLYNTIPRDAQGNLTDDPNQQPLVYADAVRFERATSLAGSYTASPIVARLKVAPTGAYPWRVVTARNEPLTVQNGSAVRDLNLGIVTSFNHNSAKIDPADDGTGRRGMVWNWPARRPFEATNDELLRYGAEKRTWIVNGGRDVVSIVKDNLSSGVQIGSAFTSAQAVTGFYGEDYDSAPSNGVQPTSAVIFQPKLNAGDYNLQIWLPDANAQLATKLNVMIFEGTAVDITQPGVAKPGRTVIQVDQTTGGGWINLTLNNKTKFRHLIDAQSSLRVAITDYSNGEGGKIAYADAIRFIKQADLRITGTPLQTTTTVNLGNNVFAQRDVVIATMENGRIYCMDARGDEATGTTNVYWVYPSESSNDPNQVQGEDGRGGIAEMPIGFDLSSAMVQTVTIAGNPTDILYVGSKNGRVYALEMAGRGDGSNGVYGTTRRRWSYPNDYPASGGAIDSALGPIAGSLSFANTPAGPTIFVPASQGRMYALDAIGDGAQKTTSVRWQYPSATSSTLESLFMTPAVEFGRIYFGAGDGKFYALNTSDANNDGVGDVVWTFTGVNGGTMPPFGSSGPATAPGADISAQAPNSVFFSGLDNRVYALNADTGAPLWYSDEIGSSSIAPVTFTWQLVFNNAGSITPNPGIPTIVVPTIDGRFSSLAADVTFINKAGALQAPPPPGQPEYRKRRVKEFQAANQPIASAVATGARFGGEQYSWMYGVDAGGVLYAWNWDPNRSDGNQMITPGAPPGSDIIIDNDPYGDILDSLVGTAKVGFVSPEDYEMLVRKQQAGTLKYADIDNVAQTKPVTRRNFEYGETLRIVVYNLPNGANANPPFDYVIEFQFNTPATASQRRQRPPELISGGGAPPGKEMVVFDQFPILGSGGNALAPGPGNMTTRVVILNRQNANRQIDFKAIAIANPLGAIVRYSQTVIESIGNTLNPADPEVLNNGNLVGSSGSEVDKVIRSSFGPDVDNPGEPVTHGQTSSSQVDVLDRSLMTLLLGPTRGITNVRLATSDLAWQGGGNAVYKPLQASRFVGYEELPTNVPNTSIDYPDMRRESLRVAKSTFGQVENPLFNGVTLDPPGVTAQQFSAYRTLAGFNNGLTRTLRRTRFDFSLDVPRFQPPNRNGQAPYRGYAGDQIVYIDANQPGRQFASGVPSEAFRHFFALTDVGIDERLTVGTPTVDLGTMPAGAGFSPLAPFQLTSPFSPWDPSYQAFFRPFSGFNDGNVNMLNLRLAKATDTWSGTARVYENIALGSSSLSDLAWLDAPLYLFSDLDPRYNPEPTFGNVVLQKSRVGEAVGNRLSVNPKRRANSNLGVNERYLYDTSLFPPGDPKLGVCAPIGTPVGAYVQDMYLMEDRNGDLSVGPDDPSLMGLPGGFRADVFEPWAEPAFKLRFGIRETRLTNRETPKSAPMIERLVSGDEAFYWANQQPTTLRDGLGNVVVAWASNRLENSNQPGWIAKPRGPNDATIPDQWRIYIATLDGDVPPNQNAGLGQSPIRDLNVFTPNSNARWFRQTAGAYPTTSPGALFGLDTGESIEPGSVNFGTPVFPTSGAFDPLVSVSGGNGRPSRSSFYMAFYGEATKRTARGDRVRQTRIFISNLTVAADGQLTISEPIPMDYDPTVRKGQLTLTQNGATATVFYSTSSSGGGQIGWNTFRNGAWRGSQSLGLSNGFEAVGSPAASLRKYQNSLGSRIDLTFTAKLRGREHAEAFLGRVRTDNTGSPVGRNAVIPFGRRVDQLVLDPATGVYWAPGAEWTIGNADLNNPATRIEILDGTGASILDQNTATSDPDTRILTFDTTLGGKAIIDTSNGSIRFTGALVPRNLALGVRYAPRFLRVSGGLGANYRGVAVGYDDRYIDMTTYWARANGQPIAPADPARNDRLMLLFGRTSADGTQATRPYMRTLRFGVQLPTAVATNNDGTLAGLTVNGNLNGSFYQVDPAKGRVYFMSDMEDKAVNITYIGVDAAGQRTNTISVGPNEVGNVALIGETAEFAIPIEQTANEAGVSMALDPQNSAFNSSSVRRPPLVWLFWTSTRSGSPDVYFQTIAPRLTPIVPGR